MTPKRIAVLASGRGSNLRALLEAQSEGRLRSGRIVAVVSNVPGAGALAIAESHGIPAVTVDHRAFPKDRASHEAAILAALEPHRIDLVALAGYMRVLEGPLLERFAGAMVNIHPSLLPAFRGAHAQRQAVAARVAVSGCTVHLVTRGVDEGPILAQRAVPAFPDDTEDALAARILREEHALFPAVLEAFARGAWDAAAQRPALLLATGNAHKVEEIGAILDGCGLALRTTREFPEHGDVEEPAPDYVGNALIKARAWRERTGLATLSDDSGLEVDALGGRPGVHSARYAATAEERIAKLLRELDGVPEERRSARFVCVAALSLPDGSELTARGVCEGRIAFAPSGDGGFGYDPVFVPAGFGGRHLAEISAEAKNRISHRARALDALRPALARFAAEWWR